MPETRHLPDNAYRLLKPGESFAPVIPADQTVPEITPRSIIFGVIMTIIFSAAAAYIALKLGQGIESAIPISILAIGFSAMLARQSTLLENVNILAIGATSGIVVGGSVFVMPAIYILGLESPTRTGMFLQIFLVPFLGAVLGVLFLIPFRRYFVADMHGKLPFPEATATTEILMSGERGGKQAVVLLYSLGLGFLLDYLALGFRVWSDIFTTSLLPSLNTLTEKMKVVFALNTSAAVLGLGYIIGVRYASIIMAGSMLSYFVLIPLFGFLDPGLSGASFEDIFSNHVRYIGIGGIFAAGFISILKMSPVIVESMKKMAGQMAQLRGKTETEEIRTEKDIPMGTVLFLAVAVALVTFLYFRFSVLTSISGATTMAFLALLLTYLIAFLFCSVSAWAVAMISITPVSGMTLTTLIISAVLLSSLGLTGREGMLATLLIGGVVCTALSMAGSLVSQFKIGYWLGSTPKSIQWSNIFASILASVTVTLVIMMFAEQFGYTPGPTHPDPLPAPQANAMAAVIGSVMSDAGAPWVLYGIGAMIAVIIEMLGISGLAFALGMYLPIELNSPLLAGAIVAWLVQKSTKNAALSKARNDRGTLIASGLIAGGALAGVFDGMVKMAEDRFHFALPAFHFTDGCMNWAGLCVFFALAVFIFIDCCRVTSAD